ncbi:MAG TPA: tyrosinase family protein [Solirubrobacterales bacterium]|nr:tyrosinase family protein [Solirubrobacterales bacterium]
MATGAPSIQRQAQPLRQRPSITEMTAPQLQELREALVKVQALKPHDDRSYQFWAGIHGLPLPMYCDVAHGRPAFLPWHRAYLYRFEQALRDTGHDVMLPWWDWTKVRRVPDAYAAETRPDGRPNPMHSVRINDVAIQQGLEGRGDQRSEWLAQTPDTFREPGLPGTHLPTEAEIARVLEYRDFQRFTSNLDDYHGNVHIWVGGHMTDIPYAAYDPVFWAHHTMIDRIWRMWQLRHPEASFPSQLRNMVMEPFHLTAGMVLDPTALGYDYSLNVTQVRP